MTSSEHGTAIKETISQFEMILKEIQEIKKNNIQFASTTFVQLTNPYKKCSETSPKIQSNCRSISDYLDELIPSFETDGIVSKKRLLPFWGHLLNNSDTVKQTLSSYGDNVNQMKEETQKCFNEVTALKQKTSLITTKIMELNKQLEQTIHKFSQKVIKQENYWDSYREKVKQLILREKETKRNQEIVTRRKNEIEEKEFNSVIEQIVNEKFN
ncbi:hypothetical protein M0812_08755 [Anaeramoeba flamelloides]|uniref:Biogenesis of lysosome-related organelles complex 1 subunit 5 n=1 Tax=Anaeramoeba flamelloides TaxID=1746091 RepID=A0AAV7ZXD2_9EUKA|nr:hypothetical protein M0812_08755 [Anaeramoeba flamelloides]